MRHIFALFPACLMLAASLPAYAETAPESAAAQSAAPESNCVASLRILNSVQMQTTATRSEMLVPVKIDGVAKSLLLDTGGPVSQVSRDTAKELGLPQVYTDQRLFDVAGNISNTGTTVRTLTVGVQDQHQVKLLIAPNPALGTTLPYDGVFTADLFPNEDLDMDFGAARLTAFSPDHCAGRVIYWPADKIAVVPIKLERRHITLPVTVDGHTMTAVVDTGSQHTAMNMSAARAMFGLGPDTPGTETVSGLEGAPSLKVYRHTFTSLTLPGVEVSNLPVFLLPDQMTSQDRQRHRMESGADRFGLHREVDQDVALPDLIIGMDVLRHLHVYLARKENRLYISEAVTGPSALFRYKTGDSQP